MKLDDRFEVYGASLTQFIVYFDSHNTANIAIKYADVCCVQVFRESSDFQQFHSH